MPSDKSAIDRDLPMRMRVVLRRAVAYASFS